MIVVPITLVSAIDGRVEVLATITIDNIGGTATCADYRVRAYAKRRDRRVADFANDRPIREATVRDHRRQAEPVSNLLAKALAAAGYKS